MSKKVKTEHYFNRQQLSDLLVLAQGVRTRTQFAKDCGISLPHLSNCINGRITTPPIPSTLKKIADCAANQVSFAELLDAAGYNVAAYIHDPSRKLLSSNIKLTQDEFKRIGLGIITVALAHSAYEWTAIAKKTPGTDLSVEVKGENPIQWSFQFLTNVPPPNPRKAEFDRLWAYYARLALTSTGKRFMHSFVTESPELFDLLVENPPIALAMYVSVVLIDTTTLSIIKTTNLKTSFPEDPSLPALS